MCFIGHIGRYTVITKIKEVIIMYSVRYVQGHVQVYNHKGEFLFSADSEREAREELRSYEESAA